MGGLANNGRKLYNLNRTHSNRMHLIRTQLTQLITHERISTTKIKCRHLYPYAERLITNAIRYIKDQNIASFRHAQSMLHTKKALKKLIKEIAPRLGEKRNHFINVRVLSQRRKGDNAQLGYIEIKGNELEKYELSKQEEDKAKGLITNVKVWEELVLKEEREFFAKKVEDSEKQFDLQILEMNEQLQSAKIDMAEYKRRERAALASKHFFQKKLQQVEHDLFILNKNKYDMRRFVPY